MTMFVKVAEIVVLNQIVLQFYLLRLNLEENV